MTTPASTPPAAPPSPPEVPTRRVDSALLLLRVITGVVFLAHGAQKIFTFGIPGVAESFSGMGIPLAGTAAPLVSFAELLGGIALALGLLTRTAAGVLAVVMLGALLLVHFPSGFFLPQGYEFVLVLLTILVSLLLAGPGAWSIDAGLKRRRSAPRR